MFAVAWCFAVANSVCFSCVLFPFLREAFSVVRTPACRAAVRIEISPSSEYANLEAPLMPLNASFTIANPSRIRFSRREVSLTSRTAPAMVKGDECLTKRGFTFSLKMLEEGG
jgi:hypothetical protein